MLRELNQVLIHGAGEAELVQKVCLLAIEPGGFRMAVVGFIERDEAKTIRIVAHAGAESGYLESIVLSWGDNEFGPGPAGLASRTGKPSVVRNIMTDPRFRAVAR